MATYYATVKVEGTASSQDFKVTAQSGSEAKKIIEMRVGGKVKFMDPLTDPGAQGAALIPGLTAARGQRGVGTPAGAIAPARRRLPGRRPCEDRGMTDGPTLCIKW